MEVDFIRPETQLKLTNEVDFQKEIQVTIDTNIFKSLTSIILKISKDVISLFFIVSLISYFFFMNNVSFKQQTDFLNQPKFSGSILACMGTYWFFKILVQLFSTAQDGKTLGTKFSSIWLPIKVVIYTSFFLPMNPTGLSIFSDISMRVIGLLQHIIN